MISNAIKILGTNTISEKATGNSPVQQNSISPSYRIRGSVTRSHTNRKQNRHVLDLVQYFVS